MLAHQLPFLPPFDSFWNELPNFLRWLAGEETRTGGEVRITEEGEAVTDAGLGSADISRGKATQSHLEMIRFAAANRLSVELDYGGSTARVEPYSLRRAESGDVLLHAWERRERRTSRLPGRRDRGRAPDGEGFLAALRN